MSNRITFENAKKLKAKIAKKNKIKKCNIVSEVLHDYCSTTTIHGIGYLVGKDKTIPEKIWWATVICLSVSTCFYMISSAWIKWMNNPVMLSFEKEQFKVGSIPFPAVTVCPVNKVLQTQYNFTDMFLKRETLTGEENDEITYVNESIRTNLLPIEDGYTQMKLDDYPRRTTKGGITSGLSITLTTFEYDLDYVCGTPISGYKIILHNPSDYPKAGNQFFLVSLNKKTNIVITPELTTSSKSLRSMSARTRNCYFLKERKLRFFKTYTQSNCQLECDANITAQFCGCVAFYMPRDKDTPVCGFVKTDCIRIVEDTILDIEMYEEDKNKPEEMKEIIKHTLKIYNECDCLPSCTSLQYTAETSETEYHLLKAALATGTLNQYLTTEEQEKFKFGVMATSQVDIFYKASQFLALHRSELYGQIDFLSNCGGFLGLFMGFSILSFLEIIYFLTIRMWYKYGPQKPTLVTSIND